MRLRFCAMPPTHWRRFRPVAPAHAIDHEGLRIFDRARARRRVASVADCASALELGQFVLSKDLRYQAHIFVHQKARIRPIARDNPRALLSAMLQGKQTIICQHRRVRMAEHAEKPALVLRQHGRVGRLVWISFARGADHTK